jgi:hypothetical protein
MIEEKQETGGNVEGDSSFHDAYPGPLVVDSNFFNSFEDDFDDFDI